jgi:hypothetical protein
MIAKVILDGKCTAISTATNWKERKADEICLGIL